MKNLIKFCFLLACLFCFLQNTLAQSQLKTNKPVFVKIEDGFTSENGTLSGMGIVNSPVKDKQGNVLIEENTPVKLNVVKIKARSWGRPGKLIVTAISTSSVDGQTIQLTGTVTLEGEPRKTEAWLVAFGGGCLVLPGIGFLGGFFIKGDEAKISADFIFSNFVVDGSYQIEVQK